MKIIAPYAYFAPEQAASSYLWKNLHEDFAKAGMDCVVYVPTPTRGVAKEVRAYYKKNHATEVLYGGHLVIKRFSLYGEGKNPFARAVRYFLSCGIQFSKCMCSKDASVLFMASTPPIIVISEDFKNNIMAKGVQEEKIVVAYNWVDQNAVVDVPRVQNKLFDKYGLDRSKFYVTYNGNIGLTQNMDMLLQVAEDFNNSNYRDINFILVGEGAYKSHVEKIVLDKKLDNVHLIPFQPYEDISYVFSLGDASLVISKLGVGANSVPSKTWSIMSASRPVLANFDENELKTIIEDNNCGIFTKAGDIVAFKESILALYNNRSLASEMGKNGRLFIMKNLTREVGTAKYVEVIKSVVKEKIK